MNDVIDKEFERLRELLHSANLSIPNIDGVTDADIEDVIHITGIRLFGGIIDCYKRMNGSNREEILAVFSDQPTPCRFFSIKDALEMWGASKSDIDAYYLDLQQGWDGYLQVPPRDVRIKQELWVNKRWFPFADFNGMSTVIYWDADPAPGGKVGQIIVYQHDPEGIYYVAPDFESFLEKSNNLLAENRREFLEQIFD